MYLSVSLSVCLWMAVCLDAFPLVVFFPVCRLILPESLSPKSLLELAARGDNRTCDMLVKDIYGGSYQAIGLKSSTIASTFGKLQHIPLKYLRGYALENVDDDEEDEEEKTGRQRRRRRGPTPSCTCSKTPRACLPACCCFSPSFCQHCARCHELHCPDEDAKREEEEEEEPLLLSTCGLSSSSSSCTGETGESMAFYLPEAGESIVSCCCPCCGYCTVSTSLGSPCPSSPSCCLDGGRDNPKDDAEPWFLDHPQQEENERPAGSTAQTWQPGRRRRGRRSRRRRRRRCLSTPDPGEDEEERRGRGCREAGAEGSGLPAGGSSRRWRSMSTDSAIAEGRTKKRISRGGGGRGRRRKTDECKQKEEEEEKYSSDADSGGANDGPPVSVCCQCASSSSSADEKVERQTAAREESPTTDTRRTRQECCCWREEEEDQGFGFKRERRGTSRCEQEEEQEKRGMLTVLRRCSLCGAQCGEEDGACSSTSSSLWGQCGWQEEEEDEDEDEEDDEEMLRAFLPETDSSLEESFASVNGDDGEEEEEEQEEEQEEEEEESIGAEEATDREKICFSRQAHHDRLADKEEAQRCSCPPLGNGREDEGHLKTKENEADIPVDQGRRKGRRSRRTTRTTPTRNPSAVVQPTTRGGGGGGGGQRGERRRRTSSDGCQHHQHRYPRRRLLQEYEERVRKKKKKDPRGLRLEVLASPYAREGFLLDPSPQNSLCCTLERLGRNV